MPYSVVTAQQACSTEMDTETAERVGVLRSVSGTYTTACTGSSEFISFIGQANNGVACLSHVESGAPRMRIDIQKAEHETSFLFRK